MLSRQHPCGPSPLFNSRNSIGHCPQRCQESKKEVCHSEKKKARNLRRKKKEGKKEESRKQENTKKKREHLLPQKGLFFFFDFTLKSCEGEHCLVERKKKSCLKLVFELYRKYQIEKDFLKKRNLFIKRQFVSKHKEKGKGERKEKRFHVMQKKKITFLFFFLRITCGLTWLFRAFE